MHVHRMKKKAAKLPVKQFRSRDFLLDMRCTVLQCGNVMEIDSNVLNSLRVYLRIKALNRCLGLMLCRSMQSPNVSIPIEICLVEFEVVRWFRFQVVASHQLSVQVNLSISYAFVDCSPIQFS